MNWKCDPWLESVEEDQLGVRQVLLQDVRFGSSRDDDVVAAVDHESGMTGSLEVVEAVRGRRRRLVRFVAPPITSVTATGSARVPGWSRGCGQPGCDGGQATARA